MDYFPYLINDLGEKLEGVLLLSHVDRLAKQPETPPKLFWHVIFEFGLQQVSEKILKLVENGVVLDDVVCQLYTQDLVIDAWREANRSGN